MVPDAPVSSTGFSGIIRLPLLSGRLNRRPDEAVISPGKALATPSRILYHHVIVLEEDRRAP
jgi:hypothetical protein